MTGTIVVTGAASGIGRAVVKVLADAGSSVVALDIDGPAMRSLGTDTPNVRTVAIDLCDDASVRSELASVHGLTGLVHCAAIFPQLSFAQAEPADLDRIFDVNFRAAFVLTKESAARMASGGSIVLLTSGAGLIETARNSFQQPFALYGASKAALDRWAAGVAAELLNIGIVLTTITPGAFVRTQGTSGIDPGGMAEIAADNVACAVKWLVQEPRPALAGQRLSAADFGRCWG